MAAGVEGVLERGRSPSDAVCCAESSAKNLFSVLRRPRRAGVSVFDSCCLLGLLVLAASPICWPRLCAGMPAFACDFLLAISRPPFQVAAWPDRPAGGAPCREPRRD